MANVLLKKIKDRKAIIGVIGLGYIGLSLLDAFGRAGFPLLGFDLLRKKIERLERKENIYNYLSLNYLHKLMDEGNFRASTNPHILEDADVVLISVATSLDQHHIPDLTQLRDAFETVFNNLRKDQLIVLQSSTYPGTTQDELLPILKKSSLKIGHDFYLAHVPEVADIGNPDFSFASIPRVVSGVTSKCLQLVTALYEQLGCTVVPCSSPKVAESAKLLQNSYRLLNISFINEMKIMFDRMGIDVWEVVAAAATKPFGFCPFYPSAGAGGDCIPTDPIYLVWKSKETDGPTTLLERAQEINDSMPLYVVNKISEALSLDKKGLRDAKILVLGVAYKKDVDDIRHSAGLKVLFLLKKKLVNISYHDPVVPELSALSEYPGLQLKSIELVYEDLRAYDVVVIVTDHSSYDWQKIVDNSRIVVDTKNVTANLSKTKHKVIKA